MAENKQEELGLGCSFSIFIFGVVFLLFVFFILGDSDDAEFDDDVDYGEVDSDDYDSDGDVDYDDVEEYLEDSLEEDVNDGDD